MPGSIRQKGPDRWQVRVSLGRDAATGRYEYLARDIRGTKRDAQKLAAKLVTEVEQGLHRHAERHTVAELLDRWMEHIEGLGRAPTTLARVRCVQPGPEVGLKWAWLNGQGVAVRTIAGRLGHANPTVTLKTYVHFLDVADRDAAEKLGDIVTNLAGTTMEVDNPEVDRSPGPP